MLLTPEDGGRVVATDGRRLACCPAAVPPHEFVLPNLAVAALEQAALSSDLITGTRLEAKDPAIQCITFRTHLNLPEGKLGAIAAVHTF